MSRFFAQVYGSWNGMQKEKIEKIMDHIGPGFMTDAVGKKILDIGAGFGVLLDFMPNAISLEPDRKMLRVRKNFVLGRAEAAPFKPGSFDVVFALDVLHLVRSNNWLECLKIGGTVIASVFCNNTNEKERLKMLGEKLAGCGIEEEFVIEGREREAVVVARKITSSRARRSPAGPCTT